MKALVRAEIRKLFSTKTILWLGAGAVAITLLSVFSLPSLDAREASRPLREQQFLFVGTFVKIFLVVIGIRIATDEYRFGTIVPTFSFTPRRGRVLAAKVVVGAGAGLGIAGLCQALSVGAAELRWSIEGFDLVLGSGAGRAIAGGIVAGTLWTMTGVVLGALVRNQVIAIVAVLVWLMALDEMLRGVLDDAARFLPGQAGIVTAVGGRDLATLSVAVATMLGYLVVIGALAAVVTDRRDVG